MIAAVVTGNLGKSAEVKAAGGGTVCKFSIASNAKVKGEKQTTWVGCSIWGKRGESLAQYLTKGTRVAASGTLSMRTHDGKTYLELNVQEIDLMGGGEKGGASSGGSSTGGGGFDDADYGTAPIPTDDLPFLTIASGPLESWNRGAL